MKSNKFISVIIAIIVFCVLFVTACSNGDGSQSVKAGQSPEDAPKETENVEPFTIPDDTLFGSWVVYGFVKDDTIYSIDEDSSLKSIYSGAVIDFAKDGSFTYSGGGSASGRYSVLAEYDGVATYLLTSDYQLISSKSSSSKKEAGKYILGKAYSSDYISCAVYDEGTGEAKAGDDVIVFQRAGGGYNQTAGKSSQSAQNSGGTAKVKCSLCNGTGYVRYYYGSSDLEAVLSGHDPYTTGPCTSCNGTGYVTVKTNGGSNGESSNSQICPSCGNSVSSLITKKDVSGVNRTWCYSCWSSYDALMGN